MIPQPLDPSQFQRSKEGLGEPTSKDNGCMSISNVGRMENRQFMSRTPSNKRCAKVRFLLGNPPNPPSGQGNHACLSWSLPEALSLPKKPPRRFYEVPDSAAKRLRLQTILLVPSGYGWQFAMGNGVAHRNRWFMMVYRFLNMVDLSMANC